MNNVGRRSVGDRCVVDLQAVCFWCISFLLRLRRFNPLHTFLAHLHKAPFFPSMRNVALFLLDYCMAAALNGTPNSKLARCV